MQIKRFINIHTILLLVFILLIAGVVYRFFNWGQRIDPNDFFSENHENTPDTFDLFLPNMDAEGNIISDRDTVSTIVCFGNAPFADDRDSEDNLANIIAAKTGATVYNCSIGGSYLAAENDTINTSHHPLDAYNFYWLVHVAVKSPIYDRCERAAQTLGEDAAPEAAEVYETLWNLDFNDVDVVVIMYDASDYLAGHEMYNDSNATDIQQFTGNLEAGIELLQTTYPWVRIIVMSPTYAFAVNEEGEYVSSDMYTYGWDVLSTYAIKEHDSCLDRNVSFVDHLYGTINEDNAQDYLTDNLHLNTAGRELVADRFLEALYYYD
jgi:lysophospholipase L1-like esterase